MGHIRPQPAVSAWPWKRAVLATLIVAVMAFIYVMSGQTAEDSSAVSSRVIEDVARIAVPGFDVLPDVEKSAVVSAYQNLARKTAHGLEFTLLGVLLMLFWLQYPCTDIRRILLSFGIALLYACTDEFHQLFVPGRGAQWLDVGIDALGSAAGIVLVLLGRRLFRRVVVTE